ncbi:MAG: MerR family transcriptional regulator [Cellulomonas sp.]|jgi:MerR family transcriptional regulator, light-induced transcriptional regulator|uniref:MerR family transcriptional regulator n=1 Tax=Cellulomonas sp. TaxID=40001 RepID=UPI0019EC9CA9|nr:MerR family transcriptional regulator [Cellulomonas sp.]MBF0689532.1 MerR family transcriptional regulator [Cellulomonas sp.]
MVPAADEPPAGPALTVAAVARRLGVAPATLRTWDRRYGLGPSEHSAGAHRRYTAQDVERLMVMRRLTIDGVAPAEAARLALSSDVHGVATPPAPTAGSDDLTGRLPVPGGGAASPGASGPSLPGGPAGAAARVAALVDAALTGRADRCAALLDPAGLDLTRWWVDRVQPALAALARRTVVERPGVDARETLVGAVLGALRARTAAPPPTGAPVVLLLPVPGEPRSVVAHVLAAALVDGGVDARLVAGPVSTRHAGELALMTRARAVVTLSESATPDLSVVARLAQERTDLPQFVMVPDAAEERVPLDRSVHRSRTIPGLVHEALAAVTQSASL